MSSANVALLHSTHVLSDALKHETAWQKEQQYGNSCFLDPKDVHCEFAHLRSTSVPSDALRFMIASNDVHAHGILYYLGLLNTVLCEGSFSGQRSECARCVRNVASCTRLDTKRGLFVHEAL